MVLHIFRSVGTSHEIAVKLPAVVVEGAEMKVAGMVAFVIVSGASAALASPLTPYRYEYQAQRHCPDDVVVWLDFKKGAYYAKGQRPYARGYDGSFACREEVRASGYRRSLLGLR